MRIMNTAIDGVKIIDAEPRGDERGFLARWFCQQELAAIRPQLVIAQINQTFTRRRGTIRGLHFQYPPFAEMKIVRCLRGKIFDVAVDLRQNSPTYGCWHGEILSAENQRALVIPEGFAHGLQTLTDDVEMLYLHTNIYQPQFEGGVRFDDPTLKIAWHLPPTEISTRDLSYPLRDENFRALEV